MRINLITGKVIVFLFLALLSVSCEKEETNVKLEFLSFSLSQQVGTSTIDNQNGSINSRISSAANPDALVANFVVPQGVTVWVGDELQTSGLSINNFSLPVIYTLQSPNGIKEKDFTITVTKASQTEEWGLGLNITASKSLNRDYEWYCDQYGTGQHQYINCGPTSVAMAILWADPTATVTPQDARNTYHPEGGWWYTTNIVDYLTLHNVSWNYFNYDQETSSVKSRLDAGDIVILCLDMYYIRSESNSQHRTDKFYTTNSTGWGHFIVVKGYKEVDGNLFFEVYDPYSINVKYPDGTYKGKDRYYRSSDLFTATQIWWKYLISVKSNDKKSSVEGALEPDSVPEARGGI
jgi:hypothetical protein